MTETMGYGNVLPNAPEYTVSEIAGALKRTVEDRFGYVRVRGEISGFKIHSSGHAYFSLKDETSVLDAVCWRGSIGKLAFKPEDGLEIIATGRITTYPGRSKYQIVVERMEPAGAGALMALLEKRRTQFMAEGLFDAARKKPLPYLPTTIGVITSPTGAVIRDILHRISDRFPLHVIVWPVLVQGEGAKEQIAEAIAGFQQFTPRPDIIIVARGGGSIEDLWAFNEEIVVRAAANCSIPLISAVGHETDTTLIDFVSDKRAPTPTASAEMAVPVRDELLLLTTQLQARMQAGIVRMLTQKNEQVQGYVRGLPKPAQMLEHATVRLDDWAERLRASLPALVQRKEQMLQRVSSVLRPQLLAKDVEALQQRFHEWLSRLAPHMLRIIADKENRVQQSIKLLEHLNYKNVLKRGFALVRADGALVTSAETAQRAPVLEIQFHDGAITVKQ